MRLEMPKLLLPVAGAVTTRTYVSRSYRLMAVAGVLISAALTVAVLTLPGLRWWGAAIVGAVGVMIAVAAWSFYGAPRLSLCDDRVEIRNPLSRHVIPMDAIESVTTGQRLGLRCRNGDVTLVCCIQAANVSLLFGRRSHVDRVAEEVGEWVSAHRGPGSAPVVVEERAPIWSSISILIAAGAVAAVMLRMLVV